MLSITRVFASRTTSVIVPKATVASGVISRSFAIGNDLKSKRKVEEERYIKSKEHEDYLKRKAAAAAAAPELSAEELAAKRAHDAAVDEAFEILSRTGCKVKDETVEALAAWKLGGK